MRTPILRQVLLDEGRKGVVQFATRLGCDGVEDQRTLARATDTCEDSDLVLGNSQRDVLQIVLASSSDEYVRRIIQS